MTPNVKRRGCIFLVINVIIFNLGFAQLECLLDPETGSFVTPNGTPCPNAIPTVMPFLRIIPGARSAGMGDVGLATSPDANSMAFNTAKLAGVEQNASLSVSYSPWSPSLNGVSSHFAYLGGYKRVDTKHTIGLSMRLLSTKSAAFNVHGGLPPSSLTTNDVAFNIGYARTCSDRLSLGANVKLIYSSFKDDLGSIGSNDLSILTAAFDVSMYYKIPMNSNSLNIGLAITNLGPKVSYNTENMEFLPTSIALGSTYNLNFKEVHVLSFSLDFHKLMVPSPQIMNIDEMPRNGIPDYREKPYVLGIIESFADAPGGFEEELREITTSMGVEYFYNEKCAIRFGYFRENPFKGNRKYFTFGTGYSIKSMTINLSYLIHANNSPYFFSPIDKTWRISLLYNYAKT